MTGEEVQRWLDERHAERFGQTLAERRTGPLTPKQMADFQKWADEVNATGRLRHLPDGIELRITSMDMIITKKEHGMAEMAPIEEALKSVGWELDDGDYFWSPSYDVVVKAMGVDVLTEASDDDYQGDSYLLVREQMRDGFVARYGYLTFGWGSCSGCDELQACSDLGDIDTLRTRLAESVHWEDGPGELLKWLVDRPWDGLFEWRAETLRGVLPKMAERLMADVIVGFGEEQD